MKYLNDHKDFQLFIIQAHEELGLLPFVIEKDYWVTRILRDISNSEFKDEIVFKGGTCLSKAYNIIERFSEDIDLLMTTKDSTMSNNQKKRRLKELRDYIIDLGNYKIIEEQSIVKKLNAKLFYNYPARQLDKVPESINSKIIVEPGYRGGSWPTSKKNINSLLANFIKSKGLTDLADELEDFELNVLSIERIFVEKLFAINCYYQDGTLKSKTRHCYDTFKLLNTPEIKEFKEDKDSFKRILKDISDISKDNFGLEDDVFIDDLINSKAFKPESTHLKELENGYLQDKALYYAEMPDFNLMIKEINKFLMNL